MKKKVLTYHYRYLPASETFIYNQLRGLHNYFGLEVVTHELENPERFPDITPVLIPRRNWLQGLLRSEARFFEKRLKGSDLFHVNFGHFAVNMQRHALIAGVPMTAYFHGVDASAYLRRPGYADALRKSHFRAVITCSENMKQRLAPYLPETTPCFVVYCGARAEDFHFKPRYAIPDSAVFLQLGRLELKKGVDVSLRAFARYVQEVNVGACLVIAGDGPQRHNLTVLARELGIENQVRFLGAVNHATVFELMHAADVFLHPSRTSPDGDMEGIPVTLCEAMATGLPVISTWHSGIPELIDHGVNGFLASEGDDLALFEQMVLLKSADVCALSHAARRKVEDQFDAVQTSEKLANIMRDLF